MYTINLLIVTVPQRAAFPPTAPVKRHSESSVPEPLPQDLKQNLSRYYSFF